MRISKLKNSVSCSFIWVSMVLIFLYSTGLYQYFLSYSFTKNYIHWGPPNPLGPLIRQLQNKEDVSLIPVNEFIYPYINIHQEKCTLRNDESIRLVYIVKSSVNNFARRKSIRNTWGFENRFSDVNIRTVFLLGINPENPPDLQEKLAKEIAEHKDIVQADFIDSYFNNTAKTMMGLHWAFTYCKDASYFFFADDDYYISTRNVLRFLRDPVNYPTYLQKYVVQAVNQYQDELYAGFVFRKSSPIRWVFSKWYVDLNEYPYSHWPPYVTAGAYVLSRFSLEYLYYASIYTYCFRFDDIFLGMAAKKAGLEPFHHSEFYFDQKNYDIESYKWVIASHGYGDPIYMEQVWNEQRSAGNA